MDDLINAEENGCARLMDQFEGRIVAALDPLALPAEWAVTARYFVIATLLRLASKLMMAALTEDPDVRHQARYVDMIAEVSRRIAPWAMPETAGRMH
jgi:hypothetical protein